MDKKVDKKITLTSEQWLELIKFMKKLLKWLYDTGIIGKNDEKKAFEEFYMLLQKLYNERGEVDE